MAKFLLPIYDADLGIPVIQDFDAETLKDAENEVIEYWKNICDIDWDCDMESLQNYLCDSHNIIIGELYDF
jgi:hypothetical protein